MQYNESVIYFYSFQKIIEKRGGVPMRQKLRGLFLLIGIMLLVAGCGGKTNGQGTDASTSDGTKEVDNETDEQKEATVALMIHWGDKEFENFFRAHIEKALPHITLTYIQASNQEEIEENFAKGLVPDLVMGSDFEMYREVDLARDQTPLIEKHGIDFDRLDPSIVESLRNASPEGELLALPLFRPDFMMAYNKDIFDAFGVPYPEDNMTWDEAIELGRQLTGEINGETYHGLWPDKEQLNQVGASLIDPETNEPNILDNKELRLFLERQQEIFNIPDNLPEMDSVEGLADFMYNGTGNADLIFDYALVPGRAFTKGHLQREQDAGLNFDWVTYPIWGGEYPEEIPNGLYHNIFVTSQSENPDAAFEVIQYLLSDDYQKWWTSTEYGVTPLVNEEVRKEFGQKSEYLESLEEKNWRAQLALPGAPIPNQSSYEGPVRKPLLISAYQGLLEGKDVNTVLRIMDDEAQSMVADLAGKK